MKIKKNGLSLVLAKFVCKSVIALGKTLEECKTELLSVLEDWIEFGLIYGPMYQ